MMGYIFIPLWAALEILFATLFLSSFLEVRVKKDEMVWIAVVAWLVTAIYGLFDVQGIHGWLARVTDGSRCYLATQERLVVASILQAFPHEFVEHIEQGGCPRPGERPFPKLVDLHGGTATYDERFWDKRPDWTYDD